MSPVVVYTQNHPSVISQAPSSLWTRLGLWLSSSSLNTLSVFHFNSVLSFLISSPYVSIVEPVIGWDQEFCLLLRFSSIRFGVLKSFTDIFSYCAPFILECHCLYIQQGNKIAIYIYQQASLDS